MTAGSSSVIRVRRLRCDYRVAAPGADLAQIRERLDGVAGGLLRQVLAQVIAPLAPERDSGVWLIRRLAVPTLVDGAWHPHAIAGQWAGDVRRALERQLAGGADGDNVVHFADRAAYLARFLVDLAGGRAGDCWYYRGFAGLVALPASAALRSALAAPEGMDALRRLDLRELADVARALSALDARRVLDALAAPNGADGLAEWFAPVWKAWGALAAVADGLAPAQCALVLFVRAAPQDGGGTRNLALVSQALAWLAAGAAGQGQRPSQAHAADRTGADAHWLAVLAACPAAQMAAILETLASPAQGGAGRATPHGGLFMLMPFLDALPLGLADAWPAQCGTPAVQLLRLLILAKCQGRARAAAVFADPLLRDLLGIGPGIGWDDVRPWLRDLGQQRRRALAMALGRSVRETGPGALTYPARLHIRPRWDALFARAARHVLRAFAQRLHGFGASMPDYLHRNFLDVSARIEAAPGYSLVHLSRPPLELILNVAGLNRQHYRLPWLGTQPFVLCSED